MRTRILIFLMSFPILFIAALFIAVANAGPKNEQAPHPKIDPPVVKSMDSGARVPVIILGSVQYLNSRDDFAAFCKKNKKAKRRKLRAEVVAKLKKIAEIEQPKILKALGNPLGARKLWLVNAIMVNLTPKEIEKAAALPRVKYIYPGTGARGAGSPGKVAEILKPADRKPFSAKGKKIPWNLTKIGAVDAWTKLKATGEGAVVAMFDAGVNYLHEDLKNNIWINTKEVPNNGKDDDENGYVDDYYGFDFGAMSVNVRPVPGQRMEHGTLTSGIVAGDGTGGMITGVAPRARLMLLKGMGGTYSAALAFQYAIENGADVINMSFSVPNLGNLRGFWRMMSRHAVCAGLVPVSGAGNFQQSQKTPVQIRIPEGIPCVVCAGGVNENMAVPRFCSLGPVEWGSVKFFEDYPMPGGLVKPDVCGFPGPRYPVLDQSGKGYVDPNNKIQGNSFSSPHVSGIIALVFSAAPDVPAWRVKEILEKTATDIGKKGKDNNTGTGLANAYLAVKVAIELAKKNK